MIPMNNMILFFNSSLFLTQVVFVRNNSLQLTTVIAMAFLRPNRSLKTLKPNDLEVQRIVLSIHYFN